MPRPSLLAAFVLALGAVPGAVAGQLALCESAERFVVEEIGMSAIAEPDTIDDWRTQAMVPGCRVTAAGGTRRSDAEEARRFFAQIREVGWTRTPDPRDSPNEASLRFRRDRADCLFSFYTPASALNTEAEWMVGDAVPLATGERLFYFLVMCTPAAPAAPRGGTGPD